MCNLNAGHDTGGAGFLVDTSAIRELIEETQEATARVADDAARIELLKPASPDCWPPTTGCPNASLARMTGAVWVTALVSTPLPGCGRVALLVCPRGAARCSDTGT